MSMLEQVWEVIDSNVAQVGDEQAQDAKFLETVSVIQLALETPNDERADLCYAAGYALYMMSSGRPERSQAESWFLQALIHAPGHRGASLFIAYQAIDRGDFTDAMRSLFAVHLDSYSSIPELGDRLVEARVYCLAKLGMWEAAYQHLSWFDARLHEDANCGIILINFLKLLDEKESAPPSARPALEKIWEIVRLK